MKPEITEIELLLDKINLLFNNVKADGLIDKIEAELFLKYIHQLAGKLDHIKGGSSLESNITKEDIPPVKEVSTKSEITELKVVEVQPLVKSEEEKTKVTPEVNVKAFEKFQTQKESVVINESKENKSTKKNLVQMDERESDEPENFGLHAKLSKEKKTLADKINNKKSTDLRTSIDLNERIYFIRQLFKGDRQAYDKVISHINSITSSEEASAYIQQDLILAMGWNDQEAIRKFQDAVQLKFK